jgi:DNA-binding beta-propeller fold protein YncE
MDAIAALSAFALWAASASAALPAPEIVPTGQAITPTAAPGAIFQPLNPGIAADPNFTAGQASAMAMSPDGRTLLILTSGYNRTFAPNGKLIPELSGEYVFVYDVSGPAPVKRQVVGVPDSFIGLAWAPAGDRFFVSGGVDDDVLEFSGPAGTMRAGRTFRLGHKAGLGLAVKPEAAGLAVSPDGRRVLVANFQNDSVSLIDLVAGAVSEQDLRPGMIDHAKVGQPGGTFPIAVAWAGNSRAYVASQRDREIIALAIGPGGVRVRTRIATRGQPTALIAPRPGRLYAAIDNSDAALAIDTRSDRILETIPVSGPPEWGRHGLGGAGANALTVDGRWLLVSDGGENAVAVIRLGAKAAGVAGPAGDRSRVTGMIPTGWYPTAVAARSGGKVFVVNGKSNTGPVPGNCRINLGIDDAHDNACRGLNQYVWQREKAGFLTLPMPTAPQLDALTRQVAANNRVHAQPGATQAATFAFLRQHIRHVIYVVKENRTYDQVLGDLEVGNGDPRLAIFPRAMTPNQHALARRFVDLDAFFDSGESSNTGWNWTVAGRTNDFTEREAPVNYASRGLQYDQEGDNRNLNVGFASSAERLKANPLGPKDPDMLPGAHDVAAPDAPDGDREQGYIWDQALKAGLTVRNWGFYGDLVLYDAKAGPLRTPREREPWKTGVKVFVPDKASLMTISDPYFRGFDQGFPDYWRFKEWEREFDGFAAAGSAPNLMMVRLPHDHTGDFAEGIDGINSVETELADNDYALGLLVQKVAHSPFAQDTLIFVVEDDAQDGPDHMDAHRSIAFVAGPYVRQGAVVSHRYQTVNLVRTLEDVLGLAPMGLTDAQAEPMTAVFDLSQSAWSYEAVVPAVLRTTSLPLPPPTVAEAPCAPRRSASYWAAAMAGQDFSSEDRLDTPAFNLALWRGLKGDEPYPVRRDGRDLSQGRERILPPAACN